MNDTYTIIQKAKLLFAEKEYIAISEQDVMQICNISKEDFAIRFNSKENMFKLILDSMSQDIDDLIFDHYIHHTLTPECKITTCIQSYMQHMEIIHLNLYKSRKDQENILHHPTVHYAYQRLEYHLSRLLLEIMNSILYEMNDSNLFGWNKDHLNQQMQQANSTSLLQALDVQESMYYSKIFLHTEDQLSIDSKREQWDNLIQLEQDMMSIEDRCTLVAVLLHFIEQYPICIIDSLAVTEQSVYGVH